MTEDLTKRPRFRQEAARLRPYLRLDRVARPTGALFRAVRARSGARLKRFLRVIRTDG